MSKRVVFLCISILTIFSCTKDNDNPSDLLNEELETTLMAASNGQGLEFFTMPASTDLDQIPQDPKNPLTPEKVNLGKLLYHETGLALAPMKEIGKGTFSCATCHFASAGFQANRHQGISDGGLGFGANGEGRQKSELYTEMELDVQPIRTPTAMNGAYQELMLWNGQFGGVGGNLGTESKWKVGTPIETNHLGYEGLETQAIAGLKVHRLTVNDTFLMETGYLELFDAAFPEVPKSVRYEREFIGLAIAAYERTLLANEAPFQRWLKGDKQAMGSEEKHGAILFFGKAGCGDCHTGPALNSMAFYGYGMNDLYQCPEPTFQSSADHPANLGRGGFTGNSEDNNKFKVPQLYNLTDSPFFGHGSSFRSVRDVVDYKNNGVQENDNVPQSNLATQFQPLQLTNEEIDRITLFIEKSLNDFNLVRYEPDALPSGQCFPNNDNLSRSHLGCE